jgi:hypothetical protein
MNCGNTRRLRLAPLALALTAHFAHAGALFDAKVAMPSVWMPGDRGGVSAIFQTLRARSQPTLPHAPTTISVSRCADSGSGTLRAAIAAAGEGDTIDLGGLTCSSITLTQGAIPVMLNDLTIAGPGAARLAIDGARSDRVFVHYGYGTLRLQQLSVRNGASVVSGYHVTGGACILSGGYVALEHAAVRDCLASGEGVYGGGVLASGVTLYTSTLSGNVALGANPNTFTAAYGGGAMAYFGAVTLYDSTVTGNRVAHDPADTHGSYCTGGGVFADFGGYALRSTIAGNYSYGTGGGFAAHAGVFLTDSTISGNTAKHRSGGGLFVRTFGDSLQFNNSTVAFNDAPLGGGIFVGGQPRAVLMQSTILANNAAADFAAENSLTITGTNNLMMAAGAGISLPDDTLQANPHLLPLADNGGPTRTHALALASPARDAGANPADLATDQRGAGYPRVVGSAADIGAVEMSAAVPAPARVPVLSQWIAAVLAALLAWSGMRGRRRTRIGVASDT